MRTIRRVLVDSLGLRLDQLKPRCSLCKRRRASPMHASWNRAFYQREGSAHHICMCIQRLVSMVSARPGSRTASACWIWTGSTTNGYGMFSAGDATIRASRASLQLFRPKGFPKGAHVLHSCDNSLCINPRHLRAGTHKENMADKVARGRANTRARPKGRS